MQARGEKETRSWWDQTVWILSFFNLIRMDSRLFFDVGGDGSNGVAARTKPKGGKEVWNTNEGWNTNERGDNKQVKDRVNIKMDCYERNTSDTCIVRNMENDVMPRDLTM